MDYNTQCLNFYEAEQGRLERLLNEAYAWFYSTYCVEEFDSEEEFDDLEAEFEFSQISFYLENR